MAVTTYTVQMMLSVDLPEAVLVNSRDSRRHYVQVQSTELRRAANFVVRTIAHTPALMRVSGKASMERRGLDSQNSKAHE